MPNRILREGILTSPRMAKLGWTEEVFYRRLMSVVDDFGRYYADAGLLRAACFPRQLNKVSDSDIGKWLRGCVDAALVRVYPAEDGERYLQLLDFRQQARATKSKYPQPPSECAADATQVPANEHLGVDVFEGVSVSEGVNAVASAPPPSGSKRKTPIPDGFVVSERVAAWAAENGFERIAEHHSAFVRKSKAKGYAYVDWDSALMEAIREDWAKLRGVKPVPAGERATSKSSDAEQTQEYLRAHDMTPEEKRKAEEARKRVMSAVKVINKEAA